MTKREFRKRIGDILARQKEERLKAIRDEVRAKKKPPAVEAKPAKKKRKAS